MRIGRRHDVGVQLVLAHGPAQRADTVIGDRHEVP
ncbi:Uncharacterised protein [Bordetella pertussis]|nr:Uncharacterised protein [Bordetella pertussis]